MNKFITCLAFFFSSLVLHAQGQLETGVYLGYANYLGDLVEPTFTLKQSEFSGGVWLRYDFSDKINFKSSLVFGKIAGDDANYSNNSVRAASFESPFIEGALVAEYDFFGRRQPIKSVGIFKALSPYAYAGFGLGLFNTSTRFGSSSPEASMDLRENYSDVQMIVPVGFGIRAYVSRSTSLGVDFGIRNTFTDYLDGVSKAGNPDNNDLYFMGALTIGYTLGNSDIDKDGIVNKKDKCPELPGPAKFGGCPDTDADGITDEEDQCPDQPGTVRLKGCPDLDGDGIADQYDDCPENAGIRRFGGCPDTDDDGIVDLEDNCPDQPGIPSLNGCPDADRDGVTDLKDECPLEAGVIALNGCPDSDRDGIADKDDLCPKEAGVLVNNGCPDKDTDGDGLIDRDDRCPELAGPTDNSGCPEIKQEDKAVLNYATANVEFGTGSDELTPASKEILDKIIGLLKKYKGYHLRINGHTDNVGDPEKNLLLSEKRAKACYNYLFLNGVDPTLVTYAGYGETSPIGDNETEDGRTQNRRVEFILSTEEF